MLDFMTPVVENTKNGYIIRPQFHLSHSEDLLTRGGDFYAVWDEENQTWTRDVCRLYELIDTELFELRTEYGGGAVHTVSNVSAKESSYQVLRNFLKACGDSTVELDEDLTFADTPTTKKMYRSIRLPYSLSDTETPAWDKLMTTLYPESELSKLMWAIGALVSGDSKWIQKFIVIYGDPGSGKSTFLNIIQEMFQGYWNVFSSEVLARRSESFPLEAFKRNPLVGIEHDGDLSRIEDNTKLNSLVSHETMLINEKFKSPYNMRFNTFLFMGTNKPVKITDAQSGLIRRLIDVWSGDKRLSLGEYNEAVNAIKYEYGGIAKKCLDFYKTHKHDYDDYIPRQMIEMTDPFFDFMKAKAESLIDPTYDMVTLKSLWKAYKDYVDDTGMSTAWPMLKVKGEAMNYFEEFKDQFRDAEGNHYRSVYFHLKRDKLYSTKRTDVPKDTGFDLNQTFEEQESVFDKMFADAPAQYEFEDEHGTKRPKYSWDKCRTKLRDLDTSKIHFVMTPRDKNVVVVDFDIKNENGEKDFNLNIEAFKKWPATYAELSKSGGGIHAYYIYEGDMTTLARAMPDNPHIEILPQLGKTSIRRKLTKCNNLPIATISSGLPQKEESKKMVDPKTIKDELHLRNIILKHLRKEIVPSTSQSMSLIKQTLEEAYASGMHYDMTYLRPKVLTFAANSTNHARECVAMMNDFKWASEEPAPPLSGDPGNETLVFFDVEVYPNLFIVVWKAEGDEEKPVIMINPSPAEIEKLMEKRLVGFNCKRYDNAILYARHIGYTNEQLFELSQRIISNSKNVGFREAENVSYTDVYDFASTKQSLKKWEIELGIHHQEMGIPWDKPVPEELWNEVAGYCANDVIATEYTFHHLKPDWEARQILATLAGSTVNDSTNHLTAKIICGSLYPNKSEYRWRNLATPLKLGSLPDNVQKYLKENTQLPLADFIPQAYGGMENPKMIPSVSDLPYFPGYAYTAGKSMYRGEDVGSGGYVYAEPGMYWNVALLDIASMHPSSAIDECVFGPDFTKKFKELKELRILIKHKEYDKVRAMWNGALAPYVEDPESAKALAYALKIAINSVYGLTTTTFDNAFRNMENLDNIVAKRGALFMVDLKHAVQEKGFQVAHIKTDSIKIPNATPEIIDFVIQMGKYYGYDFEHEATYEKMCLVNNAVYIAKHDGAWDPTGAQFAIPYVFKTLFSKEPVVFEDMCETKQVKVGAIYLDHNEKLPDVSADEKLYDKIKKRLQKGEGQPDDEAMLKELEEKIAAGHNYEFIGKIGLFCPVLPGCGGAELVVKRDDGSWASVSGAKGYRWLDAETVRSAGMENMIDRSYYNKLVDEAADAISMHGDIGSFLD